MKIKVCGLKDPDNANIIDSQGNDYLGFIFYPKSKRYMYYSILPEDALQYVTKKVGVFVNESQERIEEIVKEYKLDALQFHGEEDFKICNYFKNRQIEVIKAFAIDEQFDFNATDSYTSSCNYFLFDTKGKDAGGNGVSFDWDMLEKYKGNTPFFLSGGIGLENIEKAISIQHPMLAGVDLNSKVETAPGLKDPGTIRQINSIIKHAG